MSNIAYKGNPLGSGTITLETPNTNIDHTITLPDGSGELIQADSSGNVGIGLTSPSLPLQVKSTGNSPLVNAIGLSPSTNNNVQGGIGVAAGGIVSVSGVNSLRFNTTNTERMRIDSSGRVTMPNQPRASLSHSGSVSQSGPVLTSTNFYNTTYCNIGNHFNASTGRFTCPVAGVYRIYMRYSSSGSGANVRLRKNGNTVNEVYDNVSGISSVSSEAVVSCQTGDFLDIQAHTMNAVGGTQHKQVTFELLG